MYAQDSILCQFGPRNLSFSSLTHFSINSRPFLVGIVSLAHNSHNCQNLKPLELGIVVTRVVLVFVLLLFNCCSARLLPICTLFCCKRVLCFYGLWTSDPICKPVGLVALWLQWGRGIGRLSPCALKYDHCLRL